MKGHGLNIDDLKYKEGDKGKFVLECHTTDKLLIFATNGRFYTVGCDKLPAGRGFGEPLRLMVDIPNEAEIAGLQLYDGAKKFLVASDEGHGFIVAASDVLAQTKGGKQVLNVSGKAQARHCMVVAEGHDHVAVIGSNRKMLVFPMDELPVMSKGKGVILQKIKGGSLADVKSFNMEEGLSYHYGSGERLVEDIAPWLGKRAQAGKLPPNGFSKNNKF